MHTQKSLIAYMSVYDNNIYFHQGVKYTEIHSMCKIYEPSAIPGDVSFRILIILGIIKHKIMMFINIFNLFNLYLYAKKRHNMLWMDYASQHISSQYYIGIRTLHHNKFIGYTAISHIHKYYEYFLRVFRFYRTIYKRIYISHTPIRPSDHPWQIKVLLYRPLKESMLLNNWFEIMFVFFMHEKFKNYIQKLNL